MPDESSQARPGGDIPQADVIVLTTARHHATIGTEGNAYNISPMPHEGFSGVPRYQRPTNGPYRPDYH